MKNQASANFVRFYRYLMLGMIGMAAGAYLVAFVEAERGAVFYQQYVVAYTACFNEALDSSSVQPVCSSLAAVQQPLRAHRQAIAVGEPFLNLALVLSAGVLLLPPIRRLLAKRRNLAPPAGLAVQPRSVRDIIPPVSRPRLPGW
jgi:hypothetical protein